MSGTRHLNASQYRGLEKLGDAYAPGDGEWPSFSALGCAEHVDDVLDYLPAADRDSLKMLLSLCRWTPQFKLRWLARLLEFAPGAPPPVGGLMRLLRMGIKGVVVTLYYSGRKGSHYSGRTPLELLGYDVSVYAGDMDGESADAPDETSDTAAHRSQ